MPFKALFYKAWRINLRHYFQSVFQIALPLIPFCIIIYSTTGNDTSHMHMNQSAIIFQKHQKSFFMQDQSDRLSVVYYPNNDFTIRLMKNLGLSKDETVIGVDKESEIEKWFINKTFEDHGVAQFGVIFKMDESASAPPLQFTYTIRGAKNSLPDTSDIFPIMQLPGPMEAGKPYIDSQFFRLKVAIDDAFLKEVGMPSPNWTVQEFPYPAYEAGINDNKLLEYIPIMIAALYIYTFTTLTSFAVNEKKSGIAERLKMVGLNDFMILLNYLIHSFMIYIVSSLCLSLLMTINFGSITILGSSNFFIIWIIVVLFCLQSCSFFLAFSSLFNNPSLAVSLGVLLYFCPCAPILASPNISVAGQVFSSFMPILYFYWAFQGIAGFEGSGIGATFSTLMKAPTAGYSDIPLLALMFLSLLGTVIFCSIYIYVVNVKPGPYGYAKPWHFIFPKKYFCKINPSNILKNESDAGDTSKGLYEKVPDNVEIGLQIANLHKRFGNVQSVKDLSLDIYVGQITALLGHNGAGKTTTLSIITGMFKPTSGTILYRGYNVFSNLAKFRQDLGLCPQEDMLIGDISVWEHLLIFGMIKNLPSKALRESARDALAQVGLTHKKNALVDKLSGGMKRKLCLALALVGNPKVLVLDEPTSGLDPESRREIWNILLTFRENRVMILTTHFMEEADALGDQIAIMDHGEIKCYGTPMFLKKHYGAGYQITCCSESSKLDDITQFITTAIPSATVMNKSDEQIVFNIPSSNAELFPKLFKELETNTKYSINHIGINCTTMDDVFLKVREEADKGSSMGNQPINENLFQDVPFTSIRSTNLFIGFCQRLFSLIFKNIMYLRDKWVSVIFMVGVVPLLSSYWAISSTGDIFAINNKFSINFDLDIYGNTEVLMAGSQTPEIMKSFTDLIRSEGQTYVNVKELNKNNIIEGLLYSATKDELKFRQNMIVAGDFNETLPNVLYSSIALHSPIIAINLLYNSILSAGGKENYKISTISHPLTFTSDACGQGFNAIKLVVFTYWIVWSFAIFALIGNIFIKAPHTERTTLLKHLQTMTGLSPVTYWLSLFLWDMVVYGFALCLIFIMFTIFDSPGLLATENAAGVLVLILILFGVSGIWMVYCFSFLFKTPTAAFNLYYSGCFVISIASLVCFNLILSGSKWYFLNYLLRLIPIGPFFYAIQLFIYKVMPKLQCKICPNAYVLDECKAENESKGFIDSELERELFYLGLDWIIYFSLIMLIEIGVFAKLWNKINSVRIGLIESSSLIQVESDVAKERDRVDAALQSEGVGSPIVIVDGLAKKYARNFTAVYDVSFASKEGECFGLLGVNGAGKTTTFNILSGVTAPTQGKALIKGYDLNIEKRLCLSFIGYCPQFSALGEGLTGRQMLTLFANLRLAQPSHVEKLVNRWIILLGLGEYADRICGTYSGGNKRKLSTAMAFINNPAIILLDEPTSGVDPVTRRNLWTVLKSCQNNKQTIIISSHSMDECEAVCDRLTIMANGYMQCIGNTQHLKSLYGQGFVVLIKLKDHSEIERSSLKQKMLLEFNSKATLQDEHVMLLHYHINDPSFPLSSSFSIMENLLEEFDVIDEYSISDSSLEHVFLSFAKKKND